MKTCLVTCIQGWFFSALILHLSEFAHLLPIVSWCPGHSSEMQSCPLLAVGVQTHQHPHFQVWSPLLVLERSTVSIVGRSQIKTRTTELLTLGLQGQIQLHQPLR